MKTKVTNDGFVWLIITDIAEQLYSSRAVCIYELHADDSESLLRTRTELNECIKRGAEMGIEVGLINDLIKQQNQTS